MSILKRVVLGIIAVILFCPGLMFTILGVWGMDRGGSNAWMLTAFGVSLLAGSGVVFFLALRKAQ
jgi:hypothetical protein